MDETSTPNEAAPTRLPIQKTYKLYIGGRFPRTESGRYLKIHDHQGVFVADICRASRKDLRNAVVAARNAQPGWAKRVAFNRGQILYRMAEMLEARRDGFQARLVSVAGYTADAARDELSAAIDRLVWYAGWCDKYIQLFGATNPVASHHFNFTFPEATGVVAVVAPQNAPVLGAVSALAPIILSGNTAVIIIDGPAPQLAVELGEVFATSDLPGGVVNILTGLRDELIPWAARHMDIDAIACYGATDEERLLIGQGGAESVKRVKHYDDPDAVAWRQDVYQSPYRILPFVEFKTAWHPMGV